MKSLPEIFANNRAWAAQMLARDPNYFVRLSRQQTPGYLWIGCADSRVPASLITGLEPGEIFEHRNVANIVPHADLNVLSVLEYAVKVLRVPHVIVCGHYGCGGVEAAMGRQSLGLLDNWLRHIRDVMHKHETALESLDEAARFRRLCELNALEQAHNVCHTSIVQSAWHAGADLTVHAWIYDLADGRLRDLHFAVRGVEEVASSYRLAAAADEPAL